MSKANNDFFDYDGFVEKFKPKLTTDDCYTPAAIYDVVADYVERRYGLSRAAFVRPFWPGADYQAEAYPEGCVVVDNPPFSLTARIVDWYVARGVRFFLFCNGLTSIRQAKKKGVTYIAGCKNIVFENGADVNCGFLTNLEPDIAFRTAPDLLRAIEATQTAKAALPVYKYPDSVISAAGLHKLAIGGQEFAVRRCECVSVERLDAQASMRKTIFGGGFLLSERAAAERAAAERAAAERAYVFELSDRERFMQREIGRSAQNQNWHHI